MPGDDQAGDELVIPGSILNHPAECRCHLCFASYDFGSTEPERTEAAKLIDELLADPVIREALMARIYKRLTEISSSLPGQS